MTAKRICAFLAALLLALSFPDRAAAEIVDYALYTDIVAEIDAHPIRSYNIGGYTAVVAEDLRACGFWVIWDPAARSLSISRAMKDGEVETPESWPEYTPEPLKNKIGERAKPVYATDIVTYAAGERVESFNINGETLVWIDDLAPFGEVVWHPQERIISLTLGDPVEIALAPLIQNLEDWRLSAGAGSYYETYPCKTGTLLVTTYTGTPHGSSTDMLFVKKNGDRISVNSLLPHYVWGSGYYLKPREIDIDEPGHRLSFITPVIEMPNWPEDGDVKSLGECRCVVDLLGGTLVSLEPLSGGMEWSLSLAPNSEQLGDTLRLVVRRSGTEVIPEEEAYPGDNMLAAFGAEGVTITHYASMLTDAEFAQTEYYKAYTALCAQGLLPDAASSSEGIKNTPEQRAEAAKYFSLTLNGEAVSGDLWRSRGNNHVDLNFTFAEPIKLNDGDVLVLTVGVLQGQ